jgi:protein TonB
MFFSKFDVNKVEWLNLVFENRNQDYGAYELRLKSSIYLRNALIVSALGFSSLVLVPSILSVFKSQDAVAIVDKIPLDEDKTVYQIREVKLQPKKQEVAAQPSAIAKTDFKQIDFAPPKVVDDNLGKDAPIFEDINAAVISTANTNGLESTGSNLTGSTDGTGTGLEAAGTESGTENDIIMFADKMPEFPGGMAAWTKFLNKNLQYPAAARETGVQGRVTVSFVVEKNGAITGLKVLGGIGAGCDEEALRVIKKSPFWKPGYQNGKAVRVAYVIPIVFRLD